MKTLFPIELKETKRLLPIPRLYNFRGYRYFVEHFPHHGTARDAEYHHFVERCGAEQAIYELVGNLPTKKPLTETEFQIMVLNGFENVRYALLRRLGETAVTFNMPLETSEDVERVRVAEMLSRE